MDPLVTAVATVIGNFALDEGSKIVSSFGKAAGDVAQRLYKTVMDKLGADPAEARTVDRYQRDPDGYRAPLTDALADAVKADLEFADALRGLIAEYQAAAPSAGVSMGDVTGGVNIGDHGLQVNNPTGPVTIGRQDEPGDASVKTP